MFPCLPTPGNIVAETKFASWEAKMFPDKFRNIFVAETMFPSLPRALHPKTLFFYHENNWLPYFRQSTNAFVQWEILHALQPLPKGG